jgi:hypothetical protein
VPLADLEAAAADEYKMTTNFEPSPRAPRPWICFQKKMD